MRSRHQLQISALLPHGRVLQDHDKVDLWLAGPDRMSMLGSRALRLPFWEASLVFQQLGGSPLAAEWRPA